jgi:hypothetical protein
MTFFWGAAASMAKENVYSLSWMASSYTYNDETPLEEDFYHRLYFNADGTVDRQQSYGSSSAGRVEIGKWADPGGSGVGNDYEVRVSSLSGNTEDYSGNSTNTWLSLSTDRFFGVWEFAVKNVSLTMTVEIRLAASPFTVVASKTVTLNLNLVLLE